MRSFQTQSLEEPVLLQGGRVWNQQTGASEPADILIAGGNIRQVGAVGAKPDRVIHLNNAVVVPGFLDLHVHFREPGREDKETIESGARCAVVGGFTAVCPMANTSPVIDNAELINFIQDRARHVMIDVLPVGAVTKGQQGQELAEIGEMAAAGAVALSDDGRTVDNAEIMRMALEYSGMYDLPIFVHAETAALSAHASMNEGLQSTKMGVQGNPAVSEAIAIQRDIALVEYAGGRLHIQHLSTRKGVELIRRAKDAGLPVTSEVTPHHLALCDTDILDYDTHMKMSPPLRTQADREALIAGLVDGTIDCIGTDHAPHTCWEKELEFDQAPNGVLGLETAFGVVYRELVASGRMSLTDLIHRMAVAPRKILKQAVPVIAAGQPANMTILDTDASWMVTEEDLWSKSRNSSFLGRTLQGRILGTLHRGQMWWRDSGAESRKTGKFKKQ